MIKGCDISNFQGSPNYDQLKTAVEFIIIKTSEGTGYKDPTASRNQSEARRTGLGLGYYHFARPDLGNTAAAEADWFLNCIGTIHNGEVLTLDYEVNFSNPVGWCKAFLDQIAAKTNGNKPLLYLNKSLITSHDWKPVIDAGYGLWVAYYDNDPSNIPFDTKWPVVALKQYTSTATVTGISGNVDADVFYGDLATFRAYGYKTPAPTPTPTPTPPAGSYSTRQAIIDIYQGLCGVMATDDEINYRLTQLSQGKTIVDIINEICRGDSRFKAVWVTPNIPAPQPTPTPVLTPSYPDLSPLVAQIKAIVYSKWTYLGSTTGWKVRLTQLKNLLP